MHEIAWDRYFVNCIGEGGRVMAERRERARLWGDLNAW